MKTVTKTYANFFGANQKLVADYEKVKVSNDECSKMIQHRASPDGFLSYSDGVWMTGHQPTVQYKSFTRCCKWHETSITNSVLKPVTIYKYHFSQDMEVPGSTVDNCDYSSGYCALKNGDFLIWDKNETEKCDYIKYKTVSGTMNNNAFLSDDHQIGLTFTENQTWNPLPDCVEENEQNQRYFLSDQGLGMYLFNYSNPRLNHRERRNAARRTGVVTSDQLASQNQALLLDIEELMNEMFHLHVKSACNVFADAFNAISTNLMNQPTPVIREQLNNSYVYASMNDNLISVYQCKPVHSYQFIKSDMCNARVPLNFTLRPFSKQNIGHLDIKTNIIHHEPLPVDCHYGLKILHIENRTLEYDSKSGNITNLTNAKELHLFHALPAVVTTDLDLPIISELVMYNWSDVKSHISLNSIYESMHSQALIMKDLSVTPNHPNSKVHHDTKTYASQLTSVGLFGFLHGQTVHTNQIWVFFCCIFVTVYGGFLLLKACLTLGSKVKEYRAHKLPVGFIAALQRRDNISLTSRPGSHAYEVDCISGDCSKNKPQPPQVSAPTFRDLNIALCKIDPDLNPSMCKAIPSEHIHHSARTKTLPEQCTPLLEANRCFQPTPDSANKPPSPSAPPLKHNSDSDSASQSSDDYVQYMPKAKGFAYIHTNTNATSVNKSIVKILINGKESTALIDTGADLTILTLKAAFMLGISKFKEPEQGGKGLGGDLTMLGCSNIDIKVGDRKVTGFKAHVANLDVAYDLLLGTDCMEELGAFVIQVSKGKFHMKPFHPITETLISPVNYEVKMNAPLKVKARCHACVSVPIPLSGCETLFLPDTADQTMPILLKKVVDKGDGHVSICAMNVTDSDYVIPKHYKVGTVQFISNLPEQQ